MKANEITGVLIPDSDPEFSEAWDVVLKQINVNAADGADRAVGLLRLRYPAAEIVVVEEGGKPFWRVYRDGRPN